MTLTNSGTISGGEGGTGSVGGAGVLNTGTITKLSNNGTITGGSGGGSNRGIGGSSGFGIANGGTIKALTDSGIISKGLLNEKQSVINSFTNQVNGIITGSATFPHPFNGEVDPDFGTGA
jgi:hypothetical protein